jgi:hypothetical protein
MTGPGEQIRVVCTSRSRLTIMGNLVSHSENSRALERAALIQMAKDVEEPNVVRVGMTNGRWIPMSR